MVDKKAFRAMSYGVYIVSSATEWMSAGCVVNTAVQVTSSPAQVAVAVNKDNATAAVIRTAGAFSVAALSQDAPLAMIGTFGFKSSFDCRKFDEWPHAVDALGLPYPTQGVCARVSARVAHELDLGTHVLFVGEVAEARAGEGEPMTYAYYHQVKGGTTPPKASAYNDRE